MNIRKAKLVVTKGGSGSSTFRATLPTSWIREMGLDEETRDLILLFDGKKITVLKEEEEMQEILVDIGPYEKLKMLGTRIDQVVESDEEELKYVHLKGGLHSPYRVRVERLKEKWEITKADATKEVIELNIIKTHYKQGTEIDMWSEKINNLISRGEDISVYGEVMEKSNG